MRLGIPALSQHLAQESAHALNKHVRVHFTQTKDGQGPELRKHERRTLLF